MNAQNKQNLLKEGWTEETLAQSTTETFVAKRSGRSYELTFSPPSLYGGTYNLKPTIDQFERIASIGIEEQEDESHEFDVAEVAAYSLLYLVQENRDLINAELIENLS